MLSNQTSRFSCLKPILEKNVSVRKYRTPRRFRVRSSSLQDKPTTEDLTAQEATTKSFSVEVGDWFFTESGQKEWVRNELFAIRTMVEQPTLRNAKQDETWCLVIRSSYVTFLGAGFKFATRHQFYLGCLIERPLC